jgi:hypothetical protein
MQNNNFSMRRRAMLSKTAAMWLIRLAPGGLALELAGCGGGGGPAQSSAQSLSITGASTMTPTAMTPLSLAMAGLDTTQPFTVNISYGNGQTVQAVPTRVDSSTGVIVVTTPLYLDMTTGKTSAFNIGVQVIQGAKSSGVLSLQVLDMPQSADYGAGLGEISRNFFNYLTLGLARSLSFYQALQALPGSADTSVLRQALQQRLVSTIEMRSNIDNIVAGTQTDIGAGTLPDGTPVMFTADSVDMMDRLLGLYLQALGYLPSMSYVSFGQLVSARQSNFQFQSNQNKLLAFNVQQAIDSLSTLAGGAGVLSGVASTLQPSNGNFGLVDRIVSLAGAGAAVVGLVATTPEVVATAVMVGTAVGAYSVANDVYGMVNGNVDTASVAQLGVDVLSTASGLAGVKAVGGVGSAMNDVTSYLEQLGSQGGSGLALQGTGFLTGVYSSWQTVSTIASEAKQSPQTADLASISGYVSVNNSNGPILSGLPGVQLTDPATGKTFAVVADANGQYNMSVPVGVPGVNYSGLQIQSYDPVSGVYTSGPSGVDLSGLLPGGNAQMPSISGVCYDADAGSPDADDPDCD